MVAKAGLSEGGGGSQVVKNIKRILARFIYLFGVADHREVPLDVVKNRTMEPAGCTLLEVQFF